jgi:hypothetical protein
MMKRLLWAGAMPLRARAGVRPPSGWCVPGTPERDRCDHDEQREYQKLRGKEGWLLLRRCQCVQGWDFLERLHHAYERIEPERHHHAHDVDPARRASEVVDVESHDGDRKDHQRNHPDHLRRTEGG